MPRLALPRLAILLAVVVVLTAIPLLDGQGNTQAVVRATSTLPQATGTPAALPALPAQPPPPPAAGPGSEATAFPAARATRHGPDPGGFWLVEPLAGVAAGASVAPGPLPVVLYLSGCCGEPGYPTPLEVAPWLEHLARQGYVVVAPVYRFGEVLADVPPLLRAALDELANDGHPAVDLNRFAVVGFSYGGLPAVLYAATAAEAKLPVPRALLLSAPCTENNYCLDMPADLPVLPAGLKAVVIAYADDDVVGDQPALVWKTLGSLPAADRDFVAMRTDRHGAPPLVANHETTFGAVDAADRYGLWKLTDALLACALAGEWCEYALGDTPEQRSMGVWSDGVQVAPLRVTDAPEGGG